MKEIVSVRPLLEKIKDELRALVAAEARLHENRDEIFRRAWTIGGYLCQLKEKIGRGKWLLWLPANFPELGSTDSARTETASRCIRFFKDNPPNSPQTQNAASCGDTCRRKNGCCWRVTQRSPRRHII